MMVESNRKLAIFGLIGIVVLFLIFSGWAMNGSMVNGGMMGHSWTGASWMWIPTMLTLAVGVFFSWLVFGQKRGSTGRG